ncbi:MAG: AtpZ/AtpI family protein [Cyanobacteria bacterium REEB65]|nr:AtpZ/AtpI family protein [Cyanobacteria bacterium REEB65]
MKHVVSFSGPVILCLAAGIALDQRFGTTPLLTFGGLVLGFATGLFSVLRSLRQPPADGS